MTDDAAHSLDALFPPEQCDDEPIAWFLAKSRTVAGEHWHRGNREAEPQQSTNYPHQP